ncbi:MAG: CoA transferase [Actinobacteria bacterium]|nr:CoA transferase [Actinomycetota bacterium]
MAGTSLSAPLQGVRVFDMTRNFAGPYATLILTDLGADVIKVEDPARGDEGRYMPPFDSHGVSTMFAGYNRGKRSVAVDLKQEADAQRALDLAATCDVFIENLRPGTTERLGLGFEAVRSRRRDVLYVSISAFGGMGARGQEPGYDAMIQAFSGLMDLTGDPEGPPSRVGTGIIDIGTGMWAALNILAFLPQVRGRQGAHIQCPMADTAAALMIHHLTAVVHGGWQPTRTGTAQHNMAPYESVRAADADVLVAAASQKLFHALCTVLDAPELIDDERFLEGADRVANRKLLVAELERRTGGYSAEKLEALLRQAGIPGSRIRGVHEFADDPQLHAMGTWARVPGSERELPLTPFRVDRWRPAIYDDAPALGEHTEEVFKQVEQILGGA